VIDCIFTLDYEIYGNGTGSLKDLVYEPGEWIRNIFNKWRAPMVAFVEVAEFEKIESCGTDPAIDLVKQQIKDFRRHGFEIALHLHPQWFNARYEDGRWLLDFSEYNLCTLSRTRITQIVERSLDYLQHAAGMAHFVPLSFRAGNWLFQPTETAASVLAEKGIRIDSSVFKGGLQHHYDLDYRSAMKNGFYWPFESDVNQPDSNGSWIEVPIYAEMVPFWKMPTAKRMSFGNSFGKKGHGVRQKLNRARDFMRFRYPLKLDFCRMSLEELTSMMQKIIEEDQVQPDLYRPVVSIGHTKDFVDPQTLEAFLSFLDVMGISVTTFEAVYSNLQEHKEQSLICSRQ